MPHFAIKAKGCEEAVGICYEEKIENVQAELILGPGNWLVKEISDDEAEKFTKEWENNSEDICPICEGPRGRIPVGEIVLKECHNCGFKS